MDRREFLQLGLGLGAGLVASRVLGPIAVAGEATTKATTDAAPAETWPDLVAVKNGQPEVMFRKAMESLGGMKRFIKKGQTVVVKPNIGWDQKPEWGANTNPGLVGEIIKACQEAGAAKVYVFDHSCDLWERCIESSGIGEAAKAAGGIIVPAGAEKHYQKVAIPGGKILKEIKVHEVIIDSDVLINVPVLKHHVATSLTCAMKNLMGCVWDRRAYHRLGLHEAIADYLLFQKPTLNIVDAFRVMTGGGPRGRSLAEVDKKMVLLASTDAIAVDAAASRILGLKEQDIQYLAMAGERKLGNLDLKSLTIKRIVL